MLLLSPLGTKRVGPSIQDLSDLPTAEHKERRRQLGECFQRKINFFFLSLLYQQPGNENGVTFALERKGHSNT